MKAEKHRDLKKLDRSGVTKAERRARFAAVATSLEKRLSRPGKSTTHRPERPGWLAEGRVVGLVHRTARIQSDRKSG